MRLLGGLFCSEPLEIPGISVGVPLLDPTMPELEGEWVTVLDAPPPVRFAGQAAPTAAKPAIVLPFLLVTKKPVFEAWLTNK